MNNRYMRPDCSIKHYSQAVVSALSHVHTQKVNDNNVNNRNDNNVVQLKSTYCLFSCALILVAL